jgi:hypothetical protein
MHEQEEAGARGALIGTLLGGGVSFMGARRAAKRKAQWLEDFMADHQRLVGTALPSGEDLKLLVAPVEEAIGDKVREAQWETYKRGDGI